MGHYLSNYLDRHYLWGPRGIYDYAVFRVTIQRPTFSLYELSASRIWFEIVYHLGIVIAVLFLLGSLGRVGTLLHYIFLSSLFLRNPLILDGGDNIASLVLLWLILTRSTDVFSLKLFSSRRYRSAHTVEGPASIGNFFHNVAVVSIILQVALLYMTSGLYKAQGATWRDGTALYYIFQVPEFSWPPVTDFLADLPLLMVAATYITVVLQVAVPALLLSRTGRLIVVVFGVLFHSSIGLLMGLTSFAIYMIASECVFLTDQEYARTVRALSNRRSLLLRRRATHVQ
ncbi:HTTM domain-containing protein [Candidatus Poriferisodalis sp.]|uniref:HTTM domain-containing protein n=1 Tax=Candidatus Poriferisodalis sp. TaxID=3101277 RepID=UPI003B02A5AD